MATIGAYFCQGVLNHQHWHLWGLLQASLAPSRSPQAPASSRHLPGLGRPQAWLAAPAWRMPGEAPPLQAARAARTLLVQAWQAGRGLARRQQGYLASDEVYDQIVPFTMATQPFLHVGSLQTHDEQGTDVRLRQQQTLV